MALRCFLFSSLVIAVNGQTTCDGEATINSYPAVRRTGTSPDWNVHPLYQSILDDYSIKQKFISDGDMKNVKIIRTQDVNARFDVDECCLYGTCSSYVFVDDPSYCDNEVLISCSNATFTQYWKKDFLETGDEITLDVVVSATGGSYGVAHPQGMLVKGSEVYIQVGCESVIEDGGACMKWGGENGANMFRAHNWIVNDDPLYNFDITVMYDYDPGTPTADAQSSGKHVTLRMKELAWLSKRDVTKVESHGWPCTVCTKAEKEADNTEGSRCHSYNKHPCHSRNSDTVLGAIVATVLGPTATRFAVKVVTKTTSGAYLQLDDRCEDTGTNSLPAKGVSSMKYLIYQPPPTPPPPTPPTPSPPPPSPPPPNNLPPTGCVDDDDSSNGNAVSNAGKDGKDGKDGKGSASSATEQGDSSEEDDDKEDENSGSDEQGDSDSGSDEQGEDGSDSESDDCDDDSGNGSDVAAAEEIDDDSASQGGDNSASEKVIASASNGASSDDGGGDDDDSSGGGGGAEEKEEKEEEGGGGGGGGGSDSGSDSGSSDSGSGNGADNASPDDSSDNSDDGNDNGSGIDNSSDSGSSDSGSSDSSHSSAGNNTAARSDIDAGGGDSSGGDDDGDDDDIEEAIIN